MRALLQRVSWAKVEVEGREIGRVGGGLLVLLGVVQGDGLQDVQLLANKTVHLRIFEDEEGKMNRSLLEVGGGALVVSQFTLYGDCRKGRRPSFGGAMPPAEAEALYEEFVRQVRELGVEVETGQFRATMEVSLCNQGPVTILLETKEGNLL